MQSEFSSHDKTRIWQVTLDLELRLLLVRQGYKEEIYAKARVYSGNQLYRRTNEDKAAVQLARFSYPSFVDDRHINFW